MGVDYAFLCFSLLQTSFGSSFLGRRKFRRSKFHETIAIRMKACVPAAEQNPILGWLLRKEVRLLIFLGHASACRTKPGTH